MDFQAKQRRAVGANTHFKTAKNLKMTKIISTKQEFSQLIREFALLNLSALKWIYLYCKENRKFITLKGR